MGYPVTAHTMSKNVASAPSVFDRMTAGRRLILEDEPEGNRIGKSERITIWYNDYNPVIHDLKI